MNDVEAAAEVLAEFVPIDNADPRTQEFAEGVAAYLAARAARPSPVVLPPDPLDARLSLIEGRLDEILTILRGGAQ